MRRKVDQARRLVAVALCLAMASGGCRPVAEGFSASIARALEARDVDALFAGRPDGERRLVLTMRNEALETQAVRRLRLWAAPRPPGGRMLADPAGGSTPRSSSSPPPAAGRPRETA